MSEKLYTLDEWSTLAATDASARRLVELKADRDARLRLELETWEEPCYESFDAMPLHRPDWLIKDYIEQGTVGFLVGPYGAAKSFMALDWACCVATGLAWMNHPVHPGKVIYVAAEGSQGIGRRGAAWTASNNRKVGKKMDIVLSPVQLGQDVAVEWLCKRIIDFEASFLIIDTLARSIDGLNENDAVDMAKVIRALYAFRDARGENKTTVLVLHHTGKNASLGARGSSRLPSDTDYCYQMDRGDPFTMRCTKLKEDRMPDPFSFTLETVEVAEGIESCIIEQTTRMVPDTPQAEASNTQAAILAALRVSDGQSGTELASYIGVAASTVSRNLTPLREAGKIEGRQDDGRTWRWYLAGAERSELDKLATPRKPRRTQPRDTI